MNVEIDGRTLTLSNLEKVLYPSTGFTKRDLIDWYVAIAPQLLPHLKGRPLTLKRYPDGVEGKHFYEKQSPSHRPYWVKTVSVYSAHSKRDVHYTLCEDLHTLVWLANLADIELHPSLSRVDSGVAGLQRPTALAFDLDPGPGADIVTCCEVGLLLNELFQQLGLRALAKTSGGKGMQIYVPLNDEKVTYDIAKPYARAVARLLEQRHPQLIVSTMAKAKRAKKVLIDWSQNDVHKTTVCVYSARARTRPTVSTPITWQEVKDCHKAGDPELLRFETSDVLKRVDADGDLFGEVLTLSQELPQLERAAA